jgi:hypothetical protein
MAVPPADMGRQGKSPFVAAFSTPPARLGMAGLSRAKYAMPAPRYAPMVTS